MKTALIDSSFLYALYSSKDDSHAATMRIASDPQMIGVVPEVILPEVTFLFLREGGVKAVVEFLDQFAAANMSLQSINRTDIHRAKNIMATYLDARLDFVDCVIMALSERMNIDTVCTLDRRDFSIFRPVHCDYLSLLP
jgi:hypothetical protein